MYDLFVTHCWHGGAEHDRAHALLDGVLGLNWRNFGNPWYDPAVHISTPEGAALVRASLELQVTPAKAVILVPRIYLGSQRGRTWIGAALEIARREGIPIIGLSEKGVEPPKPELAPLADRWVPWDGPTLVAAIDEVIASKGRGVA